MTLIVKRTLLAASTVLAASAIAVVAVADPAPRTPTPSASQEQARELADVAAWANQHGLVGLSPASLHPLGCRGQSETSIAAMCVTASPVETRRDVEARLGIDLDDFNASEQTFLIAVSAPGADLAAMTYVAGS